MHLPDYGGGSIVNLMASLQRALDGPVHAYQPSALVPAGEVEVYRQVVLWVIDGLGFNWLRAHPQAACLNAHLRGAMTSVYPPTTAAAVTTFLTGDAPQQHGLTGWHMYFRELGSVLSVLPGTPRLGGATLAQAGVNVETFLGHVPFSNRIGVDAWTVSPAFIARSDFNVAHLGRSRLASYGNLPHMLAQTLRILREGGRKFVYVYWSELDSIGHHEGIDSDAAYRHLLELDRAFERLLEQTRGTDTLVMVCADHGQIDTAASDRLSVDDLPGLADMLSIPLCGEPRSAYCYLRPGCEQRFDDYVTQELAGLARSFHATDLIDGGWFGLGKAHPRLAQRIGDRVLLMEKNYILKDWLEQEKRYDLIGVHGGLSEDELMVPLIVAAS